MDLIPQKRKQLKEIIKSQGIFLQDVTLSSNVKSDVYYDIKTVVNSEGAVLIGELKNSNLLNEVVSRGYRFLTDLYQVSRWSTSLKGETNIFLLNVLLTWLLAISMLGPVTECYVYYSMVGYQIWYSYTILKFNHPPFRHMKKSFTSSVNFAMAFAIVSLGLGIFYNPVQQNQNALGAYNSPSNPSSTSANNPSTSTSSNVQSSATGNSSIALSVKQDGGVYKWTNATNGVENPELNLKTNDNNTI